MPERPVAGDDTVVEHPPPLAPPHEPRVSASDARDVDADDHISHDPYQPL
ncbi:hypothetical protein OG994_12245 [Micromonospora globbae]|uniref:Uncharacterized protein n=1 Tax=Micromonospora globbae TaxID=1894969 RepID=A0ABZ1SCU3_9ACTN|nr:hypothetical protein [Micromonospora globbae]